MAHDRLPSEGFEQILLRDLDVGSHYWLMGDEYEIVSKHSSWALVRSLTPTEVSITRADGTETVFTRRARPVHISLRTVVYA